MKIRFLGQSGYIVKTAKTEIMIDPYLSDSVKRFMGRPRLLPVPLDPAAVHCAAVICTHNHADHLDPDTVSKMPDGQFFITTGEGRDVLLKMGKNNVAALAPGESLTVGDMTVKAVFADHTVEAIGVIVRGEGKTLYFSGDTLFNEKLFEIADEKPDVTFVCINGRLGNMNTEEALKVARRIGAKVNIPTHYDMFASNSADPALFADNIPGGRILPFDEEREI